MFGVFESFDDGHSPGLTKQDTKLVSYQNKHSTKFLSIFDDLLSVELCRKAYDYAIEKGRPWGAYVTTEEALDDLNDEAVFAKYEMEKAIAVCAVKALIIKNGMRHIGKDIDMIHGTAVWCLTSSQSDEVNYHIDYAELYRYETNVIHPPLYAGTCHLSPIFHEEHMIGGDFKANIGGLAHYKKFGYKGKLSSVEEMDVDLTSADWITVQYRHNRGILHDGDYPHLSTKITSIDPSVKRVILGFNCFTAEVAESNLRAPEHSDVFNRTVKLYQSMAALGVPITASAMSSKHANSADGTNNSSNLTLQNAKRDELCTVGNETEANRHGEEKDNLVGGTKDKVVGGINVKDVMKNPQLAKLLVLAAKKIKSNAKLADSTI